MGLKLIFLVFLVGVIFFAARTTTIGWIFGIIFVICLFVTAGSVYSAYQEYCNQG